MKKTSDKTEGKKTTQTPEAINTLAWGVFTTLAWIKFRDHEIVNKVFAASRGSGGDTKETYNSLIEHISEKDLLNTIETLRKYLYEGTVDCSGIKNDVREKIDKQEYVDLRFDFSAIDSIHVGITPTVKAMTFNSEWGNLKFIVSEVIKVWPNDGDNNKQQSTSKKNNTKEYKPRHQIYRKALEKLTELNDLEYGWKRLIEVTSDIQLNNDKTLVVGNDGFNERTEVKVKSFQNAVSKMKGHLKNKKE